MVFAVKRGQNMIVMGPAMARGGLWTADNSKRITLTDNSGEEITAKAEAANSRLTGSMCRINLAGRATSAAS